MRNSIVSLLLIACFTSHILADDTTPIQEFVQGIASVYDYKVTDEIPKCFSTQDQDMLYLFFQSLTEYSNTIVEGNFNGFIVSTLGAFRSIVTMGKTLECVYKTHDFQKALEHIKLHKHVTMGEFLKMVFFYTDAYPRDIADVMNQVFPLLEKREYRDGGVSLAKNIEPLIQEKVNHKLMRINAFINGVFLRNGIATPTKLRDECIVEDRADNLVHIVKLYHDWARSLKRTDSKKAFSETIRYLMKDGYKHYTETGVKTWECIRNSEDNKNFVKTTKFNFDPFDQTFDFDLGIVLSDVKLSERYLKLLRSLRMVLKKRFRYYLLGGVTFGSVIRLVGEHGSI